MQGKTKKRYVRKQDTQSQINDKATIKNQRNLSQLDSESKTHTKNVSVQNFDDMEFQSNDKTYKFSYKFNEYIRLSLIRMLPPKSKRLVINRQEQSLKGPQNECQLFIKGIKSELQNFVMKMIKVQYQLDIDQIQFHLNPDYQVKVFRIKYVQLAAQDISKLYAFKDQSENLIKKMKNENQILIRIRKQLSQDCINDINQIVKRQKYEKKAQKSINQINLSKVQFENSPSAVNITLNSGLTKTQFQTNSSGSIQEDQDQPSFYQIQNLKKQKPQKESSAKIQKQKPPKKARKNYSCVNLVNDPSEPFEDDSVSVRGQKNKQMVKQKQERNMKKKQESKQEYISRPKFQKKNNQKQLKRYEFQDQGFDEKDFQNWLKDKRNLDKDQVIIQKKEDPYDAGILKYTISLMVDQDISIQAQTEKHEAIQVYFKFKKVILFKLKNETYKKQIIDQYSFEDEAIRIQHVKGYKSPKWNESTMWRHILKKDYTAQKRSSNTQYFEAFYIQGLMNLVKKNQTQIKEKLQKQPKNDVIQQIIFTVDQIASQIRDNEQMKKLIKKHIQIVISSYFSHICSVKQMSFVLTGIKISLLVRFDQHANYQKHLKNDIVAKLKNQLKFSPYEANIIIDPLTYEKLEKTIVIVDKKQKGFTFLSSATQLINTFNTITSIFNSINTISQKQIVIQDYLLGKKILEKVQWLKNDAKFSELKFNFVVENKKTYNFKFYGRQILLDQIQQIINQYKDIQMSNRLCYHEIVMLKQKEIAEDADLIEKIQKKHNIFISPTEGIIQCRIALVGQNPSFKRKSLLIKNTKSLDFAPINSTIIFRNLAQLDNFDNSWIKTARNYFKKQGNAPFKQKYRNCCIMIKSNVSSSQMLQSTIDANLAITNILIVMPQNDKKIFIIQLAKILLESKKYEDRQLNIYFIQHDSTINFQQLFGLQPHTRDLNKKVKVEEKIVKYFVSDGTNVFYYSKSGNQKILDATKNNKTSVILNNQDLNITHTSHKFVRQVSSILHLQSNKSIPVQIYANKVTFTLNSQTFQMPSTEAIKVLQCVNLSMAQADLSLGVYQIKFDTMQQINLFSGFTRKLSREENLVKNDKIIEQMQVQYNVKVGQIIYQYSSQDSSFDSLNKSVKQVNQFIKSKFRTKEFSLKQMSSLSNEEIQKLKTEIQEDQSTKCSYNAVDQILTVQLYDDNQFLKIQWKIKLLQNANLSKKMREQVKYPSFWQPQREPIQQFIVSETSPEFKRVQSLFTVGKIKCLIRIQNQIIYKKYYDQGQFLKSFNDGTAVRTMELFHGTRAANPEDIYKDKEQSFNINYSSDSNLLGRGIYFAERSEYSDGYKHTQVIDNLGKMMGIFGNNKINTYSMFLCEVYVGQSEKCKQHNPAIKDTSFRDTIKKIRFQSMTDFLNNSNIYVVYKSRRAYPLYLIKY